jgi:hypothetical protein
MKKLIANIILLSCLYTNAVAQDIVATTAQIGPFILGQKQSAVEQIILKKLDKKLVKQSYENYDTPIQVTLNGVPFELSFLQDYDDKGNMRDDYVVKSVKCNSKKVKTKSGIGVGWQKYEVLKKLEGLGTEHEYRRNRKYDKDGKKLDSFYETITVFDGNGKNLVLNLENGIVMSFELYYSEGC